MEPGPAEADDPTVEGYLVLFVILGLLLLWPVALFSACRFDEERYRAIGRSQVATVLLVMFAGSIAGAYFWFRIRPQLRAVEVRS